MQRATKIIATLGPASADPEIIEALARAGANLFRLNFSHGSHEDHASRVRSIRSVEEKLGRSLGILADLQGPKFRIGALDTPIELTAGQGLCLYLPERGIPEVASKMAAAPLPHREIFAALSPKSTILMDDGKIKVCVDKLGTDYALTRIVQGQTLSSKKGVNLPDAQLDISPLTPKDRADLEFALGQGVDYIALSFVQKASDILEAKSLIEGRAQIVAKIEKPSALKEIDDIIRATDAVMVARGDLGVESPAEQVPAIQKRLIAKCRKVGKPVIIATQMLESMITAATPTRAEASDVAGAVFEGTDAIMLSAESAAGSYPVEAVTMMDKIARAAEKHIHSHPEDGPAEMEVEPSVYHAVAEAAVRLAETIDAAAIIAFTASGNTAVRLARERPKRPLLVLCPDIQVERRLTLLWGAVSAHQEESEYEEAVEAAVKLVREKQMAKTGQSVIMVSGMPFGISGTTNALRVIDI
ncbi:MAG: pyruvate kinase [Candidatus Puniceispirillaceae bacterium]